MTELLSNYAAGRWQAGTGNGTPLFDPVLGNALVRVDSTGLDLAEAFTFARQQGGAALRALTYRERAALLAAIVKVLQAHRDTYYEIATANAGTVKNDSAVTSTAPSSPWASTPNGARPWAMCGPCATVRR